MLCLHTHLYFLPHLDFLFIKNTSLVMEVRISCIFVPSSTRIYGVICVFAAREGRPAGNRMLEYNHDKT